MRFVQTEMLLEGKALVDIDKLSHAVPLEQGSRLFLGAQHLDVPHALGELENLLAGRERTDDGEHGGAGFMFAERSNPRSAATAEPVTEVGIQRFELPPSFCHFFVSILSRCHHMME